MSVSRLTRHRLPALLVASLLAVGAVPLLATPAQALTQVSPTFGSNSNSALDLTASGNGGTPFNPLADELRLRRAGTTGFGTINCPLKEDDDGLPLSDTGTLVGTCDLRAAAPTVYDVLVKRVGPPNQTEPAASDVLASSFTIFGGQPTVTAVSPALKARNTSTGTDAATVSGTNLSKGTVVEFLTGGVVDPGVTFTPSTNAAGGTASDMKSLIGTIVVTNSATVGPHDVRVRTLDGGVDAKPNLFTVSAAPTITSFSPPSVGRGAGQAPAPAKLVTITGTGFQPGATVSIPSGADGVTISNVTVVSATTITMQVAVTTAAGVGSRNVRVDNPDAGNVTSALNITAAPTIDAPPNPASRGQNSGPQNIALTGSGFVATAGQQTQFALDPATGVTINSVTVNSPTSATLNISVAPNAPVGKRTIVTTNFDGGHARSTDANSLEIKAGPVPTSVNPGSRVRGFTGNVTINGTSFSTAAAPKANFGPGITVNSTTVGSSTSFTANITIDPSAEQGPRSVTVTNSGATPETDQGVGSCTCFGVDALSVTGTVPTGVVNGSPRTITITGSGFTTGGPAPTVVMIPAGSPPYQPNISGTGVSVNPAGTSITATFDFTFAAQSAYTVRVTNPNGDTGACNNCFQVLSNAPTVTSIAPASRVQGLQNQTVTINGTNFSNGIALSFSGTGVTVDAGSITLVSPTQMTAVVDVAQSAPTGTRDVVATLPDGRTGTCTACFTVTAAPTLTAVNPNSVGQGGTRAVTLTGTNFVAGATISFGNPGLSVVGNPTVVNATTINATFAASNDAPTGPVSVSVNNVDGGVGTCASTCFSVTAKPTLDSLTPNKAAVNALVNVQLNGTNFPTGSGYNVTAGEGIAVTNVNRLSATLITATFNIAANAPLGFRTVSLTAPDGGLATCANCFKVVSAPAFTSVAPTAGTQGTTRDVTITGTGFTADPKPDVSFGAGVTVDEIGDVTATTIAVTISIDQAATTGTRAITITNDDGGSVACSPECFTINAAPTIASLAPSSVARGRTGVPVTVTGEGFASDSEIDFGQGVTIVGTPTVTVNEGSADTISATINVSPDATVGQRTITVTNPSDFDASGVCNPCFAITAGRIMVVEIFDTKGTASTGDDVLTDKPVSGTSHRVVVTAKNGETPSAPTDTSFTGAVALSNNPVDDAFSGTCSAAAAGVSTCSNVVFGDLGPRVFAAQGTGDNSDRRGTVAVVTQAAGLIFTAAPTTGSVGDQLVFTVRPTSPVAGADLSGYAADRSLTLTGGGANRSSGPLDCDDVACSVTLSWSQLGTKTVKVTDNGTPSRSTPTITVNIVSVGLFKGLSPTRILDTRRSDDSDGFSSPIGSNATINVQATGRGGVPSTDVSAVVVNVTVDRPTATGYLALYPSGGTRPTSSTLNFSRGNIVANLAVVKVGTGGKIAIYNFNGNTSTILDVVGYYTASTTGAGGRLVAVEPDRIFDTSFGSRIGPAQTATAGVTNRGGVPADNVDSVILSVSAISPTMSGFLTVFPSDTARPLASTLNFPAGSNVTNLIYAKVGADGNIKIYNPRGTVHVSLDVMGYVLKTGTGSVGRFVSLSPSRVVDTRGRSNSPIVGKLGPGGEIEPALVNVGGIPATGVSAVVVNLTATEGTQRSALTAYPKGMATPNTTNVHFDAGQNFANLVVVKLGDDGKVRIRNRSGSVHVIVDVVGYLTT